MASFTELSNSRVITRDGVVTVQVLDKVSVDHLMLMLVKGAASARFGGVSDTTPSVGRDIKDLLVFPFSEL